MPHKSHSTDPSGFSFSTNPQRYQHIKLIIADDQAIITLLVNPEKGLRSDVLLKLNSYDLAVDIELADAINRLRFEHPKVRVVTITSGLAQVFSSGANIYMLKKSSHAFKVNFCKYTNETRLYLEEASQFSHLKSLCALNGTAAGGGYELALACDRIVLIDDKFANVSLPEVPLLGVLPGTGGLTRLTDKRKIRRDLADVFSTTAEGAKGQRAKDFRLVDEIYPKSQWDAAIVQEARTLKPTQIEVRGTGIALDEINPTISETGFHYQNVSVAINDRIARITIKGPRDFEPTSPTAALQKGSDLWILKAFRELDDAILRLRFFHRDVGLWQICTEGDAKKILGAEAILYDALAPNAHWFVREVLLNIGRVFKRLDTSSRSVVSVIMPDSAFAGVFAEFLFASDRSYALLDQENKATIHLSPMNAGLLPTWNNLSRLELRFAGQSEDLKNAQKACTGELIDLARAHQMGLLTFLLDEIDFADELRIFSEERASLSPDALTGMEASLRFPGRETLATKIFGRLSAWQNWIFTRVNATGPRGALVSYGEDLRAEFDWERC